MSKITLVPGLWDLGRDKLKGDWSRSFDHYLEKFKQLLQVSENMIIFGDENLKDFVFKYRKPENTQFILRDLNWFKENDFFHKIQSIKRDPNWLSQAAWLKDSAQGALDFYNPLVMSKMFLLNDAKLLDRFNSTHFYWIDAGIANTVHPGYFYQDRILNKIVSISEKFLFIAFPYKTGPEIHGFNREKINELAKTKNVDYVCRGGFFGGKKQTIGEVNGIYYHLLLDTLGQGLMGTEESVFTLMTYLNPNLFDKFFVEGNGLISKFFEDAKNNTLVTELEDDSSKISLYVLSYNSPKQFEKLCQSYEKHNGFLKNTKNYLIDNSVDLSTTDSYLQLCKKYNFNHIKKNNIGICGGRQFIAEHFATSNSNYYIFLEDDMNICSSNMPVCKNGFARFVPDLFSKIIKIMDKESYDFIKFSYSEFFGDNGTQWAWYNVPQHIREKFWPEKSQLPKNGTDPDSPKTKFNNIKTLEGLSYADGEIYYSNWPQIISKIGNKKLFLDTKWNKPFEQTWMSHIFQLSKDDKVRSAVLLLSPINHERFDHYNAQERREN
jgi:hypothetical protein